MRAKACAQGFLLIVVCFCLGFAVAGGKGPQAGSDTAAMHCSDRMEV